MRRVICLRDTHGARDRWGASGVPVLWCAHRNHLYAWHRIIGWCHCRNTLEGLRLAWGRDVIPEWSGRATR